MNDVEKAIVSLNEIVQRHGSNIELLARDINALHEKERDNKVAIDKTIMALNENTKILTQIRNYFVAGIVVITALGGIISFSLNTISQLKVIL